MAEKDRVGMSHLQQALDWRKGLDVYALGGAVKRLFRFRRKKQSEAVKTEPDLTPIIETTEDR